MSEDDPVTRRECESENSTIWREINRVKEKLEGPPHPGLEKRVDDFLVEFRTLERERERQHRANTVRLNLIIALLAMIGVYIGIVVTLGGHSHKAVTDLFRTFENPPGLQSEQESRIPPLTR